MADGYRGLFGAFPYAFRQSESWLFRSYVVVGGVFAALLAVVFALSLIRLIGYTAGAVGGTFTLSRTFFVVVGLFVVAPTVAPVLFVARRRRVGDGSDARYEALMAVAGYLFLLSLYVGLVAAMPETFTIDGGTVHRPPPSGVFATVVAVLYAVPQLGGLAFPLAGAALILLVRRYYG